MRWLSFFGGFLLLFLVYHVAEFFPSFWVMALTKVGFLPLSYLLARWQGWKGLGGYGLGLQGRWWRFLAAGLLIGMLFFGLSEGLSLLAGFTRVVAFHGWESYGQKWPLLVLYTVFPSVAEDILTRGYLFGHLHNRFRPAGWMLCSAGVFTLNHIWRLGEDPSVWAYLFLLGCALAWTVVQTRSLWLAFGIHWGSNLAFESSNTLVSLEETGSHYESTWVLAGCWLVLLGLLFAAGRRWQGGFFSRQAS
ncbi:MAG TPA: CPBP family intramembrane glutamic endopeptidase [Chitinophagaceae bacterium]|nr:CPBP family intramembrane glutamic endopeptidase [Chitinophagaceae bacterium]